MFRITREAVFSYGHRLFGHSGSCARLHGHNGRVRVTLQAPALDPGGMVADFGDVKKILTRWLEETIDHRMILHREDPARAPLERIGEPICVVDFHPTAENLARHICEGLRALGLPVVEVELQETASCSAIYTAE